MDTDRFFIVCTNLFGMGVSGSPSNGSSGAGLPLVAIADNVRAQRRLLDQIGVRRLHAAVGFSMGAMQVLHLAAISPDAVQRSFAFCGASTPSDLNRVFLEGVRGAIQIDPAWEGGRYQENPSAAMKLVGRIWAGWGHSEQFYTERRYEEMGIPDVQSYLAGFWEPFFLARDANDVLAITDTWRHADIGQELGCPGGTAEALANITAKTVLAPAGSDMYFTTEDARREVAAIPGAELVTLPGPYGHLSCVGAFPEPAGAIEGALRDLLVGHDPG